MGLPKVITDKLQCMLNAAACIFMDTHKYDCGLRDITRNKLPQLKMTELIKYCVTVTVYCCLHGLAPLYLAEPCMPLSDRLSRYSLRLIDDNKLMVPQVRLCNYSSRALAAAAPRTWNRLPSYL